MNANLFAQDLAHDVLQKAVKTLEISGVPPHVSFTTMLCIVAASATPGGAAVVAHFQKQFSHALAEAAKLHACGQNNL